MKTIDLNINGLRRSALAAFAVCGLIVAVAQGFAVRVHAEDAAADYPAPLDMTSTYADPFYAQNTLGQRSMAARDTTGVNSEPAASARMDAAASTDGMYPKDEMYPDDIYKHAP